MSEVYLVWFTDSSHKCKPQLDGVFGTDAAAKERIRNLTGNFYEWTARIPGQCWTNKWGAMYRIARTVVQ